ISRSTGIRTSSTCTWDICGTRSIVRSGERRSRRSEAPGTASGTMRRLPVRLRLTLGFAAAMALLLAALATGLYASMSGALLDEIDAGLRSRAATLEADLPRGLGLTAQSRALVEPHEAFAQVFDA